MYVARKKMKLEDRTVHYGDPIPEAETWPYHLRAAYERANYIEKVYPAEVATPEKEPATAKGK